MIRALLFLALFPLHAAAQTAETGPLSAEAFERYTNGKTLTYAADGVVYGTEQYLPGRKVMWAFTGEDCEYGEWFAVNEAICFIYENRLAPQCWTFHATSQGLIARFVGLSESPPLYETNETDKPMECIGPKVGV